MDNSGTHFTRSSLLNSPKNGKELILAIINSYEAKQLFNTLDLLKKSRRFQILNKQLALVSKQWV